MQTTYPKTVFAAVVCVYFLAFAWPGLEAGFSFDDAMNLYRATQQSWWCHLRDVVLFFRFSEDYRPFGVLVYRGLFEAFGLHSIPYRLIVFALMLANIGLAFAFARRVANAAVAALCVILFAYHGGYEQFFTNTGYIFDLLAFTFSGAAFLYFANSRNPRWWIWCGLYILALNSKEVALGLPIVIAAWELARPERRRRWWLIPLIGAAINVAFIYGRLFAPPQGLYGIGAYHPEIRADVFLSHASAYLRMALYNGYFSGAVLGALTAGAVTAAIITRNSAMRIGLVWMFATLLPIVFIFQRPLASAYLPMFGLTLFLGGFLWWALTPLQWLLGERPAQALAAVALLALMIGVHHKHGRDWTSYTPEHAVMAKSFEAMRPWQTKIAASQATLLYDSPVPGNPWNTTFVAGIAAHDPALGRRAARGPAAIQQRDILLKFLPETEILSFDLVLAWTGNQWRECDPGPFALLTVSELSALRCGPLSARRPTSEPQVSEARKPNGVVASH